MADSEKDAEPVDDSVTTAAPLEVSDAGSHNSETSSKAAPKCNSAFRKALLARLPMLGYTSWQVKDSFRFEDEWSDLVNVNADSVLGPLERVAPNWEVSKDLNRRTNE